MTPPFLGPGEELRRRRLRPGGLVGIRGRRNTMADHVTDQSVLKDIGRLVEEEHALHASTSLTDRERERLEQLKVQLDQCWDLLRQRRALREFGEDPDRAKVRPASIVENYKQ
jgi:DNA-binding GntR family transcriptional regulator